MESILALVLGLAVAYGMICLYAYFFADGFIFAKSPPTYAQTADYTNVLSSHGDGITILNLPNPTARYTILYSHGNLEDVGFIRPRLEIFRQKGFSVVAYDYPGFGTSSGDTTEESVYAAAEAAYQFVNKTLGVAEKNIILYGRSMGGGPTSYLAARHKVAGVVMQGTFVSAFRVQTGIKLLPWDRFDNLGRMPLISSPIFFAHGLADETVPVWHSQMMQAAARVPTRSLWVPWALHNNVIEIAREDFWKALNEFTQLLDHTNGFDLPASSSPTPAEKIAVEPTANLAAPLPSPVVAPATEIRPAPTAEVILPNTPDSPQQSL